MNVRRFLARLGPNVVLIVCAMFFALPLLAMARFGFQNVPNFLLGRETLFDKWSFDGVTTALREPNFASALWLSIRLGIGTVVLTLALLLPTALWAHLRVPKARAFIEFLTLLPYIIPAIALVAGVLVIKPRARWFLNSDYALVPFYVVLALPFTYRALDAGIRALDLRTLVDASRSLGGGWGTTLFRVLIPNLRTSIISSAFLIAAVVLGEYTMANVLLVEGFPRFLANYRGREPQASYALAVMSLVVTTLLFAVLGFLTRSRGARRRGTPAASAVAGPV
jgi:putative spermidine/putrescine transport system permease protein